MKNGATVASSNFLHAISVLSMAIAAATCSAQAPPAGTAIPIAFAKTIKTTKAKAGDPVVAKTTQVVRLQNGESLPKGTVLTGHVVQAIPFHFDDADYAVQQPSVLAIRFDSLRARGTQTALRVSVRVLANANQARDAVTPHGIDESDHLGTMILVGGAHYSPVSKQVLSGNDDDIVGYNRSQGVFGRLLPGTYADRGGRLHCDGTSTEQSVGIFSPDACGLYGFGDISLSSRRRRRSFPSGVAP